MMRSGSRARSRATSSGVGAVDAGGGRVMDTTRRQRTNDRSRLLARIVGGLAVAMAVSRSQQSFVDLLGFLEDDNTNVRSMAFHSLGARNNRQAVKPILEKIKISQNWYDQLYAYRALRSLGWKQKKLP